MAIVSGHSERPRRGSPPSGVVPAVWLAAATAVLVFAILTLASSWLRGERGPPRVRHHPASALATDVDLWVGDLAPGVRGVLASEWNDPAVDAAYDDEMNRDLGLTGGRGLAYYRLVVFNTSDRPVSLTFRDGGLTLTPKGERPLPMRSLASLLLGGDGRAAPASPQAATLRALGAGRETVEVPPGGRHSHPIAFERRVPLALAAAVAWVDGTEFHARRIPGQRWSGILEGPSAADVKDL